MSEAVSVWLRREWAVGRERLRDRRRLAAVVILGLAGGLIATFLLARGELSGADALAYWGTVRIWLDGGDPYFPPDPFMPWVYAPWTITLFVPWALLPWSIAWTFWRGINVLLLLWTARWAYRRHPLATAAAVAVLAAPIAATLDTGNITFLLALLIWAAQLAGPRLSGLLWALATSLKWFPGAFIVLLPPRARLWGLGFLAVGGLLLLAVWPDTLMHLDRAVNFPRPLRFDLLLLLWGAIPWLWARSELWSFDRPGVRARWAAGRDRVAAWWRDWRAAGADTRRREVEARVRAFFGVG